MKKEKRRSSLRKCLFIVRLLLLKCADNCCDVAHFSRRRYARIAQSKTYILDFSEYSDETICLYMG